MNYKRTFQAVLVLIFLLILTGCASLKLDDPYVPTEMWSAPPVAGRTIYAAYVTSALWDWWGAPSFTDWHISNSAETMEALTLVCLQGVINRTTPEIFLVWDEAGIYNRPSEYWLKEIADLGTYEIQSISDMSSPFIFNEPEGKRVPANPPYENEQLVNSLLKFYGDRFEGVVVYDPEIPETINLACMLASLEDYIVLSPIQYELGRLERFNNWEQVYDFRETVVKEGWENTLDSLPAIYQWAFDTFWAEREFPHIGIAACGPQTSDTVPYTIENARKKFFPIGLAPRDYMISLQIPIVNLSPDLPAHVEVWRTYLDKASGESNLGGGSVFGVFGGTEENATKLYSEYGMANAFILNSNSPLSGGNISLLSAIDVTPQPYEARIDDQNILNAIQGDFKAISVLWTSDGDSMQVLLDRGFPGILEYEKVAGQNISCTINPTLYGMSPLVWNWYREKTDTTGLVAGFSGAGYVYPGVMTPEQIHAYCSRTIDVMGKTGLRVINVDTRFSDITSPEIEQYVQEFEDSSTLGFLHVGSLNSGIPFRFLEDSSLPFVQSRAVINYSNLDSIIEMVKESQGQGYVKESEELCGWTLPETPGAYQGDVGVLVNDPKAHGGKALLFSPETNIWTMAVGTSGITLTPGEYNFTIRIRGCDLLKGRYQEKSIANVYVGRQTPQSFQLLTSKAFTVTPELLEEGEYIDITISFKIKKTTDEIGFFLDYFGGRNGEVGLYPRMSIYVDTLTLEQVDGYQFPEIIPLFVSCMTIQDFNSLGDDFSRKFEDAGGIVLSIDELLYSLNPTYMITLAERVLGSDSPIINMARKNISKGRIYDALIELWRGLKDAP